jgi:hypothetical protein
MIYQGTAEANFRANGFVVLPEFVTAADMARLRSICDRVLSVWRAETPPIDRATNMAYLTEPRYHAGRREELLQLLGFIAAPEILGVLESLDLGEPLFHNTQYFMEGGEADWIGPWHRDTQFLAPNPNLEKQRIAALHSVHFRIAFTDDARLDYVPGSERRWDRPAEEKVRRRNKGIGDLADAQTIRLRAGDAAVFHAWGIHRGHYGPQPVRRTLDIIYGFDRVADWSPPAQTCLGDESLLAELPAGARDFYGRCIAAGTPYWR